MVYDQILPGRRYIFDVADQEFADGLKQGPEHTEQCKKAQYCIRTMLASHRAYEDLCPILFSQITLDVMVRSNRHCSRFFDKFSDFTVSMIESLILTVRRIDDAASVLETCMLLRPTLARFTSLQLLTFVYKDEISPPGHGFAPCPGNQNYPATITLFGNDLRHLLWNVSDALPYLSHVVYPSDRPLYDSLFTFTGVPGPLMSAGGRHVYINFEPTVPDWAGRSTVHGQMHMVRQALARRSILGDRDPVMANCIELLLRGTNIDELEFWSHDAGMVRLGLMVPMEEMGEFRFLGWGVDWQ